MSIAPESFIRAHGKFDAPQPSAKRTALRPFTVRNAEDVVLNLDRPYLIKNWMYRRQISFWYGPSTSGKTFLMQHIAWSLALGRPIFGNRTKPVESVLYISMEPGQIEERIIALRAVEGETDRFHFSEDTLNLFDGPTAAAQIVEMAKETNAALIVIDPISAAMAGANENDFADVSVVIDRLRWIATNVDAHVAVVAHTGKDSERGQRGSSHWFASGDLVVSVKEDLGGERVLEILKARDAHKGGGYRFKLNPHLLGTDNDGDERRTLTVEEIDAEAPQHSRGLPKLSDFQAMVLKDALKLLENENHTVLATRPREGMPGVMAVRRETLRSELQKNGRLESTRGEPLTRRDVGKLRDALAALERKGVLCSSDEWVWRA